MLGRSGLIAAALMAAATSISTNAQTLFRAPRDRRPELATGPSGMFYGTTKRSGGSVAQAKRAATKSRNRARNKAAHRG